MYCFVWVDFGFDFGVVWVVFLNFVVLYLSLVLVSFGLCGFYLGCYLLVWLLGLGFVLHVSWCCLT